ncbi:MAG: AAA family ATPase, partial [Acidimicrobiia bacterium]
MLEFEPGVAVVVGPNGSGKSNVVDAVAWVLGAQGARSLRGGKMDDVIFAGTPKRPPASRAEVTLTLDNSLGEIPVKSTEVTITRSLTRDGESGYALNGEPCRLMDIAELLSDTGVGRTQHVIVGQGRLDHILTARPEDRRSVIEEAAGILKYRQRKEKAQRRLEATAVNLDRITDLVKEVRRHLKPLERQADAALRHDGLCEELRAIRVHLAGCELRRLHQRAEALAGRRAALADAETRARTSSDALNTEVAAAEAVLAAQPGDLLGDAAGRAESLLARTDGLIRLVAEKRRGTDRALSALADAGVVETLTAEAARLRADLAEVAGEELALPPVAPESTPATGDAQRHAAAASTELSGLAAAMA